MNQAQYYDNFTSDVFISYFSTYNPRIAAAKELCKKFVLPGDRILEIGCGVGIIAKSLQRRFGNYTGIDLSEQAVEIARRYVPKAVFCVGDVLTFSLTTQFDAVILIDVVEHISDLPEALRKLEKHLSDNGRIIISCPTADMIDFLMCSNKELQIIDNPVDIDTILNATGLQLIYLNYFGVEYTNQYMQLVLTRKMPIKPIRRSKIISGIKSRWLRLKNRRMIELLRKM